MLLMRSADIFLRASLIVCMVQSCCTSTSPILFTLIQAIGVVLRILVERNVLENVIVAKYLPSFSLMVNNARQAPELLTITFVYVSLMPLRVFLTSEHSLYLPVTVVISMASTTYQPTVLQKMCLLSTHMAGCWTYIYLHIGKIRTDLLVCQLVWCQLLLYAGFLVTSYHYKAAGDQLKEYNEQLQQMNASKSNFLSTIAHEIRTPLNAIIGSAEMILNGSTQNEYGKIIITSANSLLECMNDMLQFIGLEKKPSTDVSKYDQEVDFNARTLVKEVLDISAIRALNNDQLTIVNTWNVGNGSTVIHANYSHIKSILLNLVSNAIKFTPKGTVLIHVDISDESTTFEIRDTGIGMSEEFKQRIFTPFAQQDASIKQRFGGTGLGLSICKSLADVMQASLTFSSAVGIGTKFVFQVPCKRLSHTQVNQSLFALPEIPIESSMLPSTSKYSPEKRVLVVDDNPINVKVMSRMIESCNSKCKGVVSAKEALDLLNTEQFDIIILDLQMPEMSMKNLFFTLIDGIECAMLIRQRFFSGKCPAIILVTGAEMSMICEQDRHVVDKIYQKPMRMQTLQAIIAQSAQDDEVVPANSDQ